MYINPCISEWKLFLPNSDKSWVIANMFVDDSCWRAADLSGEILNFAGMSDSGANLTSRMHRATPTSH